MFNAQCYLTIILRTFATALGRSSEGTGSSKPFLIKSDLATSTLADATNEALAAALDSDVEENGTLIKV